MNEQCEIVRDLLPLYLDGAASPASEKMAEDHLAACQECTQYLAGMKAALPQMTADEKAEQSREFDKVTKDLKRKSRLRTVKKVLLGIVLGMALILAGLWGWGKIAKIEQEVPLNAYNVYLSQLKDGRVVVSVDYLSSMRTMHTAIQEKLENGVRTLYVVEKQYWVKTYNSVAPMQNTYVRVLSPEDMRELSAIRQGSGEDGLLVWKTGDAIPAASEEMETYFFWNGLMEEMIWNRYEEGMDGKIFAITYEDQFCSDVINEQLRQTFASVPEWQPYRYYGAPPFRALDSETLQRVLDIMGVTPAPAAPEKTE